jgi:hypothetical protein
MEVFKKSMSGIFKNPGVQADTAIAKANINCNETEQ